MCLPLSDDLQHNLAHAFLSAGWNVFSLAWVTLSGGFHSPMRTKYMNTSTSHYCWEGEQRDILLDVFTRFCRFSKGAFCRKSHISTGMNGGLKPGKLRNLIWHIGDRTRQFSISLLRYSGSRIFANAMRFYWLTRYKVSKNNSSTLDSI